MQQSHSKSPQSQPKHGFVAPLMGLVTEDVDEVEEGGISNATAIDGNCAGAGREVVRQSRNKLLSSVVESSNLEKWHETAEASWKLIRDSGVTFPTLGVSKRGWAAQMGSVRIHLGSRLLQEDAVGRYGCVVSTKRWYS